MYVKAHEEPMMAYRDYWMHKVLLFYVPPILLCVGTVGNLLSFCVLVRRSMRKTSTYNYLATLALTDMLILYVGLLRLWIGELTGVDLRDQTNWGCKLISMAGYTVSVYSVWLLIAVTVERYIVTVHSLHAPTMCTRSRAVKVIAFIIVALLTTNLHFLWTVQLGVFELEDDATDEIMNINMCASKLGFDILVDKVWPWVDAFLYCFSPFVIICILNGLIVHRVLASRQQRRLMAENSSRGGSSGATSGESSVRVTAMLLTISFTFLICTLPMNAVMIKSAFMSEDASLEEIFAFKLARTISELLMYTNHSLNFYIYLLTGNKFRQELQAMFSFCQCGKREQQRSIHRLNNYTTTEYSTIRLQNSSSNRQEELSLQQLKDNKVSPAKGEPLNKGSDSTTPPNGTNCTSI